MTKSRFEQMFNRLSLFGGVYTGKNNSPGQIVDEVHLLQESGFDAAYIENDLRQPGDIDKINLALEQIVTSPIFKAGVNIVPDGTGREILTAYKIAKQFNLPFIINDEISGLHIERINGVETEMQMDYLKLFEQRDANPQITVMGGINPPYSKVMFPENIFVDLNLARLVSDAILVKTRPGEKEIPADRIRIYAGDKSTDQFANETPSIVVLAQGLTAENLERVVMTPYARYVGGLIIGSGLRDENYKLSKQKMQAIKYKRDSLRESIYS